MPRLLEGRLLRGANVHHPATAYVALLDPGLLARASIAEAGGDFIARFVDRFPKASLPADGSLLGALLEAILAVERLVAVEMGRPDAPRFGRAVHTDRGEELVWEATAGWISKAAVHVALRGVLELLPGRSDRAARSKDFETTMSRLMRQARRRRWTPAAAAIVRAATEQRVAHDLLAGSYVRLGEGVRQQVVSASSLDDEEADTLVGRLFPFGRRATIPVALVMGERGTRFVARALDRTLRASRTGVGLALPGGVTIHGRPLDPTSVGRRQDVRTLLADPRVEAIVGAVSPHSLLARGLGLARADVVVLTPPAPGGDPSRYEAALGVVLASGPSAVVLHARHPFAERVVRSAAAKRIVIAVPSGVEGRLEDSPLADVLFVYLARDARGSRVELREGGELVGSMPLAWPRPEAPVKPTSKERARALVASGAAFAIQLLDAVNVKPSGADRADARRTSYIRG